MYNETDLMKCLSIGCLSQLVNSHEGAPLSYGYCKWKVVRFVAIKILHPFPSLNFTSFPSIMLLCLGSHLKAGEYPKMHQNFQG